MAEGVRIKSIGFTIDEDVFEELDDDPTVKTDGRSAVQRRAVAEFLVRAKAAEISLSYSDGCAATGGWTDEESDWLVDGSVWATE